MKKILIRLFLLSIVSCSNTDNVDDSSLNGKWTLTNVSCFCGFPDPPEFNLTEVTFDSSSNQAIVSNTGSYVYFRENGTYSYSGSDNQITFENGQSFVFEIRENKLQLVFVDRPEIADDEVSYSFSRN